MTSTPTPSEISLMEAHQRAFEKSMRESFPDADGFLIMSPAELEGPTGTREPEPDPRYDWPTEEEVAAVEDAIEK